MKHVLVQASSRSWQGWPDFCTNPVDDKFCVQYTVDKFLASSDDTFVTLIAPEFDKTGEFPEIFQHYPKDRFKLSFSHDASPLQRMVEATDSLSEDDYFIRVDGLHFAVLSDVAIDMLNAASTFDCIKFPDDFPIQFTADVYRVGAIRQLSKQDVSPALAVHPKYAFMSDTTQYSVGYIDHPEVNDDYLNWARQSAMTVYVPRHATNQNAQKAGDLHTFHYDVAMEYIKPGDKVLDCSSGCGEGSAILAKSGGIIVGGDIDSEQVAIAEKQFGQLNNVEFDIVDITNQPFNDKSFDVVACLETIEHVDDMACVEEIYRVLKPGGLAIISTPQNCLGHIPINRMHEKEYTLEELSALVSKRFTLEKIIAIKQGRIIIEGHTRGNNMMLFCRKPL